MAPTKALYDVLGVSADSKPAEIIRAYRALALKYHPDKSKEPEAKERFQRVKEAYDVLSSPRKRKRYDRGEEDVEAPEWARPDFDPQEIEILARTYPNSDDELEDLRKFLISSNGDVKCVFEWIPFAEPSTDELNRLMGRVEELLVCESPEMRLNYESSRLTLTKSLPRLRRKAAAERKRHENIYGDQSFEDLARQIQANQRNRAERARKHFEALADLKPSHNWKGGRKVKKANKV